MKQELYQELGGLDKLRQIIDTFVDTMFDDVMIGFFFRKDSKQMLKDREFEFAARFLGADIIYTGKPLGAAHKNHKIKNGQFSRRKQIFKETLESYDVPKHIIDLLMEHTESFRVPITKIKSSDLTGQSSVTKLS